MTRARAPRRCGGRGPRSRRRPHTTPGSRARSHPVAERVLGGALELGVDRQPERVPARGCCTGSSSLRGRPSESTNRRATPDRPRRKSSYVASTPPSPRSSPARSVSSRSRCSGRPRRHGRAAARRARPGVVPQVAARDDDARELVPVLVQVIDLVGVDAALHGHRRQRIVLPLRDVPCHRRDGNVHDRGQLAQHLVAALLRQVGGPDLHRAAGGVPDKDDAVAVDDRPARRLDAHGAEPVVLGAAQVLLAGEDLKGPQAQEEHREDREHEHAEDPDPERELRRQAVRLLHARIGRQEPAGAWAAEGSVGASQGVHLRHAAGRGRAEQTAAERVDRDRQQDVEGDRRRHRLDQDVRPPRRRLRS